MRKTITLMALVCFLAATSAFAQTRPQQTFDAEMLVSNGKNQDEEFVSIQFGEDEVTLLSKKPGVTKTFKYSDIRSAEYSYSKKPRYATGAALGLAVSVFLLPLMFTKTQKHWMTIQTGDDYAVLKLRKSNYRMILPALETHGAKVIDAGNQNQKKKDDSGK